MVFGHCCRRAGASGEEPDSELGDRKLILEEVNGSSNFFFSALLLVRAADLSEAEPTLTHMSIACLHKHNLVSCFFLTSLMFCLRVINPAGKRKIFRILFDYVFWLKWLHIQGGKCVQAFLSELQAAALAGFFPWCLFCNMLYLYLVRLVWGTGHESASPRNVLFSRRRLSI